MQNSISDAERKHLFGDFKWTRVHGDFVHIEGNWEKENITTVNIPQLKGVSTDGGVSSGKIEWNHKVVEQLQAAWKEVEDQGLLKYVLTFDGSFVPRVKRNGSTLSNHAYGSAFDINAQWNWLGTTPAKSGQKGDVHPLVPIFKTHGFYWGGDWTSPKDGMHFEVARIISYDKAEVKPEAEQDKTPKLVISDNWQSAINLTIVNGSSQVSIKKLTEYMGGKWEAADKLVPAGQALMSFGYKFKWDNEQKKLYAYKP